MKTIRLLATTALFAVLSLMPAQVAAAGAAPKTVLQVRVEAPFVFDIIREDDIEEALFFRVSDALRAKHRDLEIRQVDGGQADAGAPLLTISLIHWRVSRMGDIECRFAAEYHSADGRRSLGVFEGTTSSLVRTRGFASTDFERAAEDAGRRLGEALRKQGLI